MIDTTTKKPLIVETFGDTHPRITLPEEQLERVKGVLDTNKVPYWVDEESLSIDGGPFMAEIYLSYRADPLLVQRILDNLH